MFDTVIRTLRSPQNVGMIVRSHVAFGGRRVVMLGYDRPWRFGPGTRAFSRGLEGRCEFVYLAGDDDFFQWCAADSVSPVALEVASPPALLDEFAFPPAAALVVGDERMGLPAEFLARCAGVATVPQYGPVGSLNVAVACSLGMYEACRGRRPAWPVDGAKYARAQRDAEPDVAGDRGPQSP